jgi:sugar lactone lactonase YvrE
MSPAPEGFVELCRDLRFPEAPRWHDGAFWFSDLYDRRVKRVSLDGIVEVVCELHDAPSGLGWLPDGRLLVVSMDDRAVLRQEPDGSLVRHADLSRHAPWPCNDMVVAADGTAYVGHFGWDFHGRSTPPAPATVLRVTPAGEVAPVAFSLFFPNGMVLAQGGRTLIVAESAASRLTAYNVRGDGSLSHRRLFAAIPPDPSAVSAPPDGICLDASGAVWVAEPVGHRVLRVREGGEVLEVRHLHGLAPVACALGGDDGRTLAVCAAGVLSRAEAEADRGGVMLTTRVDVPGA